MIRQIGIQASRTFYSASSLRWFHCVRKFSLRHTEYNVQFPVTRGDVLRKKWGQRGTKKKRFSLQHRLEGACSAGISGWKSFSRKRYFSRDVSRFCGCRSKGHSPSGLCGHAAFMRILSHSSVVLIHDAWGGLKLQRAQSRRKTKVNLLNFINILFLAIRDRYLQFVTFQALRVWET